MTTTSSPSSPTRRGLLYGSAALALVTACSSEKKPAPAAGTAASGSGPQQGKKVIFVVHDKNPFFAPVEAGFKDFGALMGWTTQFIGPAQQDVQKTVELQQSAINAKPAGLILTRVDERSFDDNIRRALGAGTKVVLSNVASGGYDKLGVGFVGQDFVPAGEICGREICAVARKQTNRTDGKIVLGNGAPGNSALEQRIEGMKRGIAAYNKENGTAYEGLDFVSSFDQSQAIGKIDALHTRLGDQIVGWSMAGIDHQYVAAWVKQKNIVTRFGIGGFDLVGPVLEGIRDGSIHFSLGQNPYAQGWIAAALIAMEIDPGFPAKTYDTGAEVVDAGNIQAVLKRESRFI
ncbi:substrate-binding domain-containing protein [Nonomuraea lactucae]|uniref:substrate-binding domain-containing protein n=1 Tax=Nonomuraea lactucae TaxID=2249762 RepID=UPI000DE3D943|nr:substrate-binding domain-containing protein [Nonomuraea lactucae]